MKKSLFIALIVSGIYITMQSVINGTGTVATLNIYGLDNLQVLPLHELPLIKTLEINQATLEQPETHDLIFNLIHMHNVIDLHFHIFNIDTQNILFLAQGLRHKFHLKFLKFHGCETIDDIGSQAIFDALQDSPKLEHLSLLNHKISTSQQKKLRTRMRKSHPNCSVYF